MQFINHYSFLLLAGFSILALLIYTLQRGFSKHDLMAVGALLLGFSLAFWIFQPFETGQTTPSPDQLTAGTTPVLVQFQSPYCLACMAAKPLVNRLLSETEQTLNFVAINIHDPSYAPLVKKFGVRFTPTFLVLDQHQNELYRSIGTLDVEGVLNSLHSIHPDS
ncbi:MAG: hypothetical protein JXA25_00860 [Anaerolineales bacterium]|nr:hypothetical protein [Anaerolineales bacterium]